MNKNISLIESFKRNKEIFKYEFKSLSKEEKESLIDFILDYSNKEFVKEIFKALIFT